MFTVERFFMLHPLIEHVVKKGIPVNIEFDPEKGVLFNLNTNMSSDAHLSFHGNGYTIYKRYNESVFVEFDEDDINHSFRCLCHEIKECMHGRDFLSHYWEKVLLEEEVLKKEVVEHVKYS